MKKQFKLFVMVFCLLILPVLSQAVTEQQVAELYVATFNRAPDKPGLDFWVNDSGFTIEQIAESFFDQTETQALYSFGTTETVFVTSVYSNLFNRVPDAAGLAYWVDALGSGALTRPVMIQALKNGSLGMDAEIIANKTEVGLYYANKGMQEYFSLSDVTGDLSTVEAANSAVDYLYQISFNDPSTQSGTNSFFPQISDTKQSISWRYRINNGQPVDASFEGISLNMRFNDLTLSVNKSDMIRKGSFSGSFSGQASGDFTANFSENLEPNSSMMLLNSQTINIDMAISAEGVTANIEIYANTVFNTPMEWFLDNDNLDEMAYGQYDTQGAVSGNLNGYVNITAPGYGSENIPISEYVTSTETWSIVDKLDTYTVGGKIYNNVVVVDRTTILPPGFASNYNENISMRYWVAKGIGMIKGINQYQMLGQSLTIELVDTNLQ